ncbi:MAG: baseplate J/gp47 family protein [Eubacteriales bacterium]|nr:baseplate J/gp47 family protein [Eubacteriales bacterium]
MKTYSEILNKMLSKYSELSGFTPAKSSDTYIKFQAICGELYAIATNLEWVKRQLFVDEATGEYLDRHAESRGIVRKNAKKATSEVVFSITEPALFDIEIPKGTVVSTAGESPLRFETLRDCTISMGTTARMVEAVAMSPGKIYNVGAGKVTVVVTPPAGVEKVTNPDPFIGGEDAESDEDLRARIIESMKIPLTGANAEYYRALAMSVEGVTGACVVPKSRGLGTVDVYISSVNAEYSDDELLAVQKLLDENREVNLDLVVKKATPKSVNISVSVEPKNGYGFAEVKERCKQVIIDYVTHVGAGGIVRLTELGERLYHTEGVKEYLFATGLSDTVCESSKYPTCGVITVSEGISR